MSRRGTLAVLGVAALISVALAVFALERRAAEGATHYTPVQFLPGLPDRVKDAASIRIESRDGTITATYSPKTGWILPGHGGYPADFDMVRHTLIGLATLETIAPKTARADWLHFIDLDAPPKGAGTRITVKDAKGAVLADVITGSTETLGTPDGSFGLFVRRPGENQSYLARTAFVPSNKLSDWLMPRAMSISATQLKTVTVTPIKGPVYTVARAKASDPLYQLTPLPKSRIADPRKVNSIPFALTTFSFIDVKRASDIDFSKATRLVAHTFDGLAVTLQAVPVPDGVWVRISAATDPGATPAAAKQSEGIATRTAGWAYKMTAEKGRSLLNDLTGMLLPPGSSPFGIQQPVLPSHRG